MPNQMFVFVVVCGHIVVFVFLLFWRVACSVDTLSILVKYCNIAIATYLVVVPVAFLVLVLCVLFSLPL